MPTNRSPTNRSPTNRSATRSAAHGRELDDLADLGSYAERIREELLGVPGSRKGPKSTFIRCPFHSERTPSGHVNHDPMQPSLVGRYFCFGCKKKATWNELASALGLQQFGKSDFVSEKIPKMDPSYYDELLLQKSSSEGGDGKSNKDLMFFDLQATATRAGIEDDQWRGFPLDYLSDTVAAELCFSLFREAFFVYLPVSINQEVKGYILARIDKHPELPSYLNQPKGNWVLKYGMFPFDAAVSLMRKNDQHTMVIVEGPRDALRLIYYGIPAVSILGTNSWSMSKMRLLEFAGVRKLIIAMDGDLPGRVATYGTEERPGILHQAKKRFSDVRNLKLWVHAKRLGKKKLDPGNMPKSIIERVRNALE